MTEISEPVLEVAIRAREEAAGGRLRKGPWAGVDAEEGLPGYGAGEKEYDRDEAFATGITKILIVSPQAGRRARELIAGAERGGS